MQTKKSCGIFLLIKPFGGNYASKKYHVKLSEAQRQYLQKLTTTGKASARKLYRARILLLADEAVGNDPNTDEQISLLLGISRATVRRFVQVCKQCTKKE